jgi:hypothetical protein
LYLESAMVISPDAWQRTFVSDDVKMPVWTVNPT